MFYVGSHGPELHDVLNIFSSYNKLHQLAYVEQSQEDHLRASGRLLHSATLVLRAVAKTLRTILTPSSKLICTQAVIADVNAVLCSTLSRVILLLGTGGADKKKSKNTSKPPDLPSLNSLFAVLASDIVVPLIKAFGNLSKAMLPAVFLATKRHLQGSVTQSELEPAHRNATLDGLLTTLKDIGATVSSENRFGLGLLNVIRLSAIAEIDRIYTLSGKEPTDVINPLSPVYESPRVCPVTSLSRRERLLRLGRKDALWYLCAVINDAILPKNPTRHESVMFAVVQSESEAALSTILGRCSVPESITPYRGQERLLKMDMVEMGMVASVTEKIWLAG